MSFKKTYGIQLSSLFTPENIEIYTYKENLDSIVFNLLKNLALNYGIGNVKYIFNSLYKENKIQWLPIRNSKSYSIYHFRLSGISSLHLALAYVTELNSSPGNSRNLSKFIIVVVCPKKRPDLFLRTEKALNLFFEDEQYKEAILKCPSSDGIWNFFNHTDSRLPDFIYAKDIMNEIKYVLNENNTLKDAIDLFVRSKMMNIPVVDMDGELIGEVNANELMNICLPRHILWMDDVKPVINFEPYYNMLEHEDNTWLAEIMTHDIATIQSDDYAMKAAIKMTKKESQCAYVLENKKLVGLISLEYFLNKVLR